MLQQFAFIQNSSIYSKILCILFLPIYQSGFSRFHDFFFNGFLDYKVLIDYSIENRAMRLGIMVWYFLGVLVMGENLIKDGDLDNYTLPLLINAFQPFDYGNFLFTGTWYGTPDKYANFYQVRNINRQPNTNCLQVIFGTTNSTCQDIILQKEEKYQLEFKYFIDGNSVDGTIMMHWNDQLVFNQTVYSHDVFTYSEIFVANSSDFVLCFSGYHTSPLNIQQFDGVIADNLTLVKITEYATETATFMIEKSGILNTLQFTSNFSINESQLEIFTETQLFIEDQQLQISKITLNNNSQLVFLTELSKQIYPNSSYSIALPKNKYRNAKKQYVEYIFISSQQFPPILVIKQTQSIFHEIIGCIALSAQTLRVVGLTVLVFKLIAFANIMILYIFLDVDFMADRIRQSLEIFAQLLLENGFIASLYEIVEGKKMDWWEDVTLTNFTNVIDKIDDDSDWHGSSFKAINFNSNYSSNDIQDFSIMGLNILKIVLIYIGLRIYEQSHQKQWLTNIYKKYRKSMKKNILIEIVAISPSLMIISGLLVGKKSVTMYEYFEEKLFLAHFFLYPCIFLAASSAIFVFIPRPTLRLLKEPRKIVKIKERLFEENCEWFENLRYALIGFAIGMKKTELFFCTSSLYYILYLYYFIRNWHTNFQSITNMIIKLIEVLIHCSFFTLYIFTKIFDSAPQIQNHIIDSSVILSFVIFFAFLSGCCFQILNMVINIMKGCIQGIRWLIKRYKVDNSNKVADINRISLSKQKSQKKKEKIPEKQRSKSKMKKEKTKIKPQKPKKSQKDDKDKIKIRVQIRNRIKKEEKINPKKEKNKKQKKIKESQEKKEEKQGQYLTILIGNKRKLGIKQQKINQNGLKILENREKSLSEF